LDISKQLVELHGGTIEVESAGEDKGATFVVRLPPGKPESPGTAKTERKPKPRKHGGAAVKGLRVLLVEDDARTRRALSIVMRNEGVEVIEAESAAAAIEAYGVQPLDVIVSDIGLPEEDGYALIQRIRAHEKSAGKPEAPAIALSAFARDEDRLRAMQCGFQKHLGKPVDAESLVEALGAIARK